MGLGYLSIIEMVKNDDSWQITINIGVTTHYEGKNVKKYKRTTCDIGNLSVRGFYSWIPEQINIHQSEVF